MKENIQSLKELIDKITPIDKYAERKFHISQMRIAKPLKSLGALDKIAYQIAGVRGITQIDDFKKSIVIFAGDHGIASKHVSLFKSNVTSKVFKTIADGLAPINVIAKQVGADITLVDLGLKECIDSDNFLNWKVKEGTNDMTNTVAMSISETIEAILKGAKVLETEKNQKFKYYSSWGNWYWKYHSR
ncbi:nicotinate-nucleotide--dimethylbenzimidazole phosphoribosyltransferase [Bacillus cereus]